LMLVLRGAASVLHLSPGANQLWTAYNAKPVKSPRIGIEHELQSRPGDQLAVVRYNSSATSSPQPGWVYNRANIEQAKVVWAWDMGPAENRELIYYFRNRQVWLVEANEEPPRVSPYPIR